MLMAVGTVTSAKDDSDLTYLLLYKFEHQQSPGWTCAWTLVKHQSKQHSFSSILKPSTLYYVGCLFFIHIENIKKFNYGTDRAYLVVENLLKSGELDVF